MKKLILGLIVMLASALAFALPSPKQIEDALAAQKYADAKSMVQEVLREKPKSARAHLLNAFLLIHIDHNKTAANAELQTASGLDLDGDVKHSPLFGRVVAEIDLQPSAKPVKTSAYSGPSFNEVAVLMLKIALLIAGVVAVAYFVSWLIDLMSPRRTTEIHYHGGSSGSGPYSSPSPDPVSPAPAGTHYAHTVAPVVVAQQQPAMGAFGTAASVAGGVVAGNLMADSLLHRHSHHHRDADDDYEEEQRRRRRREEDSYSAPSYTPSPVSYESERSSFSSGSSDSSWESSDSSSSDSSSSSSDW